MMYDYAPTPRNIYNVTGEALKEATLIKPAIEQLNWVSAREKLPENSQQLHSLLMIEGDLIAGELKISIDWLEELAAKGSAKYIEPGLWIAVEQEQEYLDGLIDGMQEARMRLVQRLLRYRGAKSYEQIAERYLWTDAISLNILALLLEKGSIVEDEGFYYHTELYDRARHETIKSRRRQITTLPAQSYAALISNTLNIMEAPIEQLRTTLLTLCDQSFPVESWESILLPPRVKNYRIELMDAVLSDGSIFWKLNPNLDLCFHKTEDIDWDADMTEILNSLEGNEKVIYSALLKMGASFMQRLNGMVEGSPFETLLSLAIKGLVSADSFLPVRQCMNLDKFKESNVRLRVSARTKLLSTGRWEVIRPLKSLTIDELLHRNFDRMVILCRETIKGMAWGTALETLRIWEYTGQVRRGYFIEGLSGIQFIREKDYETTLIKLDNPREQIVWLNATDPAQPFGKSLQHFTDRKFQNIAGTVVALHAGVPVALLERQGKRLRVFEEDYLIEALIIFKEEFNKRCILTGQNRIVIKEYPIEATSLLERTGFIHEIQDYVLYRS
jgi:ATP-dependent Lhr-like helicase